MITASQFPAMSIAGSLLPPTIFPRPSLRSLFFREGSGGECFVSNQEGQALNEGQCPPQTRLRQETDGIAPDDPRPQVKAPIELPVLFHQERLAEAVGNKYGIPHIESRPVGSVEAAEFTRRSVLLRPGPRGVQG